MPLVFSNEINLTTSANNSEPKLVDQLSIIHEAQNGDITQYYIDKARHSEGDKASNAIGIAHKYADNKVYYTYQDYPDIVWPTPGARITRRRIDRLGVKAFPNVGAIAHYKLAYQNLSKILAPVNYKKNKTKAPILAAVVNPDNSITFTISYQPANGEDDITYQCFRITMQLDVHRLEYVSYEQEFTIPQVLVTGEYICYATGYVNEGEVCSDDSNEVMLNLVGTLSEWPAVTPGAEAPQTLGDLLDVHLTTATDLALLRFDSANHKWTNMSLQNVTQQQRFRDLQDTDINSPLHHQLIRYNSITGRWENYTSQSEDASESAAHIVDVVVKGAKKIIVEVDSLLKEIVSTAYVVVKQGNEVLAIASTNTLDPTHLQITLSTQITMAFDVTILMDAFRSPQTDAGPYHCNTIVIDLIDYTDSTTGMTGVNFESDDGTTTMTIPAGFEWLYNNANIANLVISGNSFVGLGRSSEDVKVNRRDTYIYKYWYQIIDVVAAKVLKFRWEGWSPYSSRDDSHKFIWEMFLIDNGDAYIHLVSKAGSASWDGAFTFNGLAYQLNDNNKDVSFKRVEGALGTQASDWTKEDESYGIIAVV